MLNKLWRDFEASFEGQGLTIKCKRPNLDKLLDQEEHTIHTNGVNNGTVHVFCHTEMFNNEITPVITFHTSSARLAENFTKNKGFVAMQYISHWIKAEYKRMMDNE